MQWFLFDVVFLLINLVLLMRVTLRQMEPPH